LRCRFRLENATARDHLGPPQNADRALGKGEVVGSIPPRSTIKARTSRSAIPATEQIVVRAYVNNRIQVRRVLPEDDSVAIGRRL